MQHLVAHIFYTFAYNYTFIFSLSKGIITEDWFLNIIKLGIIPTLGIILTVLIATLLINHNIHLEIAKRIHKVEQATDDILIQLLFWQGSFESMKTAVQEFKYAVPYQKRWCRQFVLKRILQLKQNFQLDDETLLNIYKLFEFEKITYNLLTHKKWHKRSLGIYQLQFLHDTAKKKQLDTLIQESNTEVKSNALITLVTFAPERFAILANYEEPLTKADEIKIMDIIYHSTPTLPKNTHKLLSSSNTSIVVLGIKLMVLYKVKPLIRHVIKLVRLSNFRIRTEAIKAVGKLKYSPANNVLMAQYGIEQYKEVKINILRSLKHVGNANTISFLEGLLATETDPDLKFKIIDALLSLDPDFFDKPNAFLFSQDEELKSMAAHVKDPYLV